MLKIPIVSRAQSSCRCRGRGLTSHLLKSFSSKLLILSIGLPRRRSPAQIAAIWYYRLLIEKLDTTLRQSILFLLSFFSRSGSPQIYNNTSKWGLHIIKINTNIYGGVFLKSWANSHHFFSFFLGIKDIYIAIMGLVKAVHLI